MLNNSLFSSSGFAVYLQLTRTVYIVQWKFRISLHYPHRRHMTSRQCRNMALPSFMIRKTLVKMLDKIIPCVFWNGSDQYVQIWSHPHFLIKLLVPTKPSSIIYFLWSSGYWVLCPFCISRMERMIIGNISRSISMKAWHQTSVLNPQPPD